MTLSLLKVNTNSSEVNVTHSHFQQGHHTRLGQKINSVKKDVRAAFAGVGKISGQRKQNVKFCPVAAA